MIQSLPWREHVRKKPGMYLGATDEKGLVTCITELVANSIEQHLAGICTTVAVTLHNDDSASVRDDGPGIRVTPIAGHDVPFLELSFTTFNSPRANHPFPVMGLAGVGAKCVNVLSEWMSVNTSWANEEFQIVFEQGRVKEPLRKLTESKILHGTLIRFKPDAEIFRQATFNSNKLARILEQVAVLHPGLSVRFIDERSNSENPALTAHFHFPNGAADYLRRLDEPQFKIHPEPVQIAGEHAGVKVAIAFQYIESMNTRILSFANSSLSPRGGTHVAGFLCGLADAVNQFAGPGGQRFEPHELRVGLTAIVSVWLKDLKYAGASRCELINPEVESVVHKLTFEKVHAWIAEFQGAHDWFIEQLDKQRSPNYGLGKE